MKILVLPRDPNPYQGLLYGELERLGAQVSYLGELTPSRTLNLLLLPLETAARRAAGARLVHVHWVFGFGLPGARRFPALRRLAQAWFGAWLRVTRLLGLRMVWTAHNVLPHSPVFADDAAARRDLVGRCDLVLAHSPAALAGLAALGAEPRRSLVIRHGPMGPVTPAALRTPGTGDGPREFLFFGRVAEYKGVEELLTAFGDLPAGTPARLTVAGQCDDTELRARLAAASAKTRDTGGPRLRLEHIPDHEVPELLAGADVVVLPFRQVTTSGSAELALAHTRPLIVPDLPGLAGLPSGAVTRYDGSVRGLTAALADLTRADSSRLAAMSAAARGYTAQASWREIAAATLSAMESAVSGANQANPRLRAAAPS
jgi:glycosyltransferase involved in cell wall biosynthesis